jgi:hypothetical protein
MGTCVSNMATPQATECAYNVIKKASLKAWVVRPVGLIKEGAGEQALKVVCRVAKWKLRFFPKE